jgi:carboxyl-terminal processing protease
VRGVLVLVCALAGAACPAPGPTRPPAPTDVASDDAALVEQLRALHMDGARIPAGETDLGRAIAAVGDPWTRRYTAEAGAALFADVTGTAQTGIGLPELLSIDLAADGRAFEIVAPAQGSAAHDAGLAPHDRVVAIDGVPARPGDYARVMAALRRPIGDAIRLEIDRAGERRTVALAVAALPAVAPVQTERDGDALVVRFGPFGSGSATAFVDALARERADTVVLDLRGHTGGQLDAVLAIAGALVGETAAVERVVGDRRETIPTEGPVRHPGRIEVRVDAGTASAAEVLVAILRASPRVAIAGDRTFGKCLVHGTMPLPEGGFVLVTTARLAERGEPPWCGRGLAPTVVPDEGRSAPRLRANAHTKPHDLSQLR